MKYNLLIVLLCSFSFSLFAQPDNDDCIGIIDFGDLPYCPTVGPDAIHTNVDATASDIGFGNLPSCFNAASERDVWFSFTATADLIDIRITLTGTDMGPNGVPITNPEIALYRGECAFDGLAELACISAAPGETTLILDVLGLTPDVVYFIRVNDYSETATPNSGDFSFCIDEISEFLCGDIVAATGCSGTFFDSGGPDEDYTDNENCVFTICPADPHACITLDVISLNLENNFDFLNVYAGATINSPQIASLTGVSTGDGFDIQASSDCVTLQFTSDGGTVSGGFEIAWQCSPLACDGTSIDDPIVIGSIPYNSDHSTCDDAATFNTSPCTQAPFLNGAETVFIYDSPGGLCASIELIGAEAGTGILVMDGPPDDPATVCYGQNDAGLLQNVNFEEPGEYYIVVANATECTDYTLVIQEVDCALSPALADALCNPLNGCIEDGGVPSIFFFEDGFQDIPNTVGTNNGCWFGVGFEPDYYWFTIEAQADGPFGFILESANLPSDIDFNVWGPFEPVTVCESPGEVINFITNNQPIRSSYAGGTEPTGLADVHPQLGYDIEDVYDCDGNNDDIVMTIAAQAGEVYVVLANDWGNQIQGGGIQVDWGPSDPNVLAPILPVVIMGSDTAICAGETVQLLLSDGVESTEWIGDNANELSCTFCADPIASPTESTTYRVVVSAVCYTDTLDVPVQVLDLEAGPDIEVCLGEQFEIPAGEDFLNATYAWTPPAGLEFSCTDCAAPVVTAMVAGLYQVPVTLTAEFCDFEDFVTINVLSAPAPVYDISDDSQICNGESISIGGTPGANVVYDWTSVPASAPIAPVANPEVSPTVTTTYYMTAMNGECPTPSMDSVTVSVVNLPIAEIVETPDTLCLGDTISLSNIMVEGDVGYGWTGPTEIIHPDSNYTQIVPQISGIYTITADRNGCQVTDDVEVNVVNIDIDLQQPDEVLICLGEVVNLNALVTPSDLDISWDPDDLVGPDHVLTPETYTEYTATVQIGGCIRQDMFAIQVDSLPSDMSIVVNPDESSYCQGELVTLISPTYDPANFPGMTHQWESIGGETADSLYNFVLTTVDTFTYIRTSVNGACTQMDSVTLNVITVDDLFVQTPDESCPGAEVQLTLEGGATGEITWEDPSGTLSCTDCLDPIATPTQTTTYSVTSDIEGCEAMTSVTIPVTIYVPLALIQGQEGCQVDNLSFSLNNTPQQPGTTYTWTGPGFSSNEAQPQVSPTTTTTYMVTAVNDCGTETGEVTISIIEPATLIAGDDVTICLDNEFDLTSTSTGGGGAAENFTWNYDNQENDGNNTSFTATSSGYAYINYTYGPNPDGCETLIDSVFVDVLDATYSVDIEIDPTDLMDVYQGTPFNLNAVITSTGDYDYSFQWLAEEGSTFSTPTEQSTGVVASLTHVGDETYTVLVSIPEGCVEEATLTLEILEAEFEIPNVFSPNQDNINEVFGLYAGGGVEDYSCKVFNRWGQLVFESNALSEFWDGTYNDEDAPSDVYIYLMNFKVGGVNYEEKGDVTLVR